MVILKSDRIRKIIKKIIKIITILLFIYMVFFLFSLYVENEIEKEENENHQKCYNDTHIKFLYDEFYFDFNNRIENEDFEGMKILHIHNRDTSYINYRIDVDRIIIDPREVDLRTQDTIKIIIRDSTFFTLRDFRNGARYGGKKFLGCSFSNCLINNKRRTNEDIGIFMFSTL